MKMAISLVAALTVSSLLFTGNVRATECTITNTGPRSDNECVMKDECDIEVDNTTDIDVDNTNDQTSTSGDSESTKNTGTGGATSGSSSNSNGTDVGVEVTNGSASCENVTAPVAPTNPGSQGGGLGGGQVSGVSTTAGGRGGAEAQVVAPAGGVGAGTGGAALSVLAASLASVALGASRLRKLNHA